MSNLANIAPRLAARFLIGGGHDVIVTDSARFAVMAVNECYPTDLGETLMITLKVLEGEIPSDCERNHDAVMLDGDFTIFARPDDIMSAMAA